MIRFTLLACLVALAASTESSDWAWGSSNKDTVKSVNSAEAVGSQTQGAGQITSAIFATSPPSDTVLSSSNAEEIVDTILNSGREGRALGDATYQQVASEPALQQALAEGNDAQARHIVKERLCNLGLMACDGSNIAESKSHLQPHDVFYAQPVAIKPVGQPIPAVPVRTPHAYKPFSGPVPPSHGGYPRPPGYGPPGPGAFGPPAPGYGPPRPSYNRPPPIGTSGIYGPPKPVATFEHEIYGHKNQQHKQDGFGAGSVQHVHHHYHHGEGGAGGVLAGPGPVLGGGSFPGSYGGAGLQGFKKTPPPVYEHEPEVEDPSGFAPSGGDYGSPFYKKELSLSNNNKKQKLLGGGNGLGQSYAGGYPGYEAQRADNCYCVPLEQCPPNEVIGRKEDNTAYLIDPRNVESGIEAEAVTEVTSIILEESELVKREQPESINNATETTESTRTKRDTESSSSSSNTNDGKAQPVAEAGTRTGRSGSGRDMDVPSEIADLVVDAADADSERSLQLQVPGQSDNDSDSEGSIQPQIARLFGLGESSKVKPTFGVSFGLPYGYGQPYPLNPFSSVPSAVNPFYGSVGPGGLDLGLVSVNPLVSFQVTKDDFGEKIFKPLVNLHVTPNSGLIHKVKGLFHGHGGHGGYGHGPPPYPPPHYHGGGFERPPFFKPHFPSHPPPPPPFYGGPYRGNHEEEDIPYDDDEEEDYDYPSGRGVDFSNNTNSYRPQSQNYRSETSPQNYRSDATSQKLPSNPQYYRTGSESSPNSPSATARGIKFPRNKRSNPPDGEVVSERQFGGNFIGNGAGRCGPRQVCCRRPGRPAYQQPPQIGGYPQCGRRNAQGINGRIKNPVYVDGDSEFGEYPWQAAILKKDAHESVYVCGGTLIDSQHVITAAHCVKGYNGHELRVRLGEWDVNHDVEFYPYIETDVAKLTVHPEFYAGTLYNDLAVLKLARPVDLQRNPHISPACLPDPHAEYAGTRCYTTGWGKDAFGDFGKYQNILKEVDIPVVSHHQCQSQLQQTRLGYDFKLHPGFVCAGGEEGKDACKGDGGGPMVCERGGSWQVVGVVSWGIGCGQYGVPGVYVKVAHYLDWIRQVTGQYN